ncbi:MAG: hypothetical protein ABI893_04875 [Polaromonas sp.]|uniref:hypothetical protein n=1 Tax=Polaromonas sp. TaxID=1869339 RepID=UPI003266D4DA
MQLHVPVPQPSPGAPDIYVPNEVPPLVVPPAPGFPPEVTDPPPPEPTLPIREPATNVPPQAVSPVSRQTH